MTTRPPLDKRTAALAGLPIVAGPVVLMLCWTTLGVVANAQHAGCWDGFKVDRIAGPLARDYFHDDINPLVALFAYAAQCVCAYVMLFVFGAIALQRRARAILVAISLVGTILVSLFFCVAYVATYGDLASGGMLCDLGFELIPYGGLGVAALAVAVGSLAGWLIGRRTETMEAR